MRDYEDAVTSPKALTLEDEHQGYLVTMTWEYPSDYTGVYLKRLSGDERDEADWVYSVPFYVGEMLEQVMHERRSRDRTSYFEQSTREQKPLIEVLVDENGDEMPGLLSEALRRALTAWKAQFADVSKLDELYALSEQLSNR